MDFSRVALSDGDQAYQDELRATLRTLVVAHALRQFATAELVADVMPGVLAGATRLCLGYTEPDGKIRSKEPTP